MPVHVDGQVGDHDQVPVNVHQLCLKAVRGPHHQPPGDGQGPVKPGRAEHTAVFLHVQLHIVAFHLHFRVLLDLERGGIAVAGNDLESGIIPARNLKRDQRGHVAGDKIAPSGLYAPAIRLLQLLKSLAAKARRHVFHRVEAGGAVLQECQQPSQLPPLPEVLLLWMYQ